MNHRKQWMWHGSSMGVARKWMAYTLVIVVLAVMNLGCVKKNEEPSSRSKIIEGGKNYSTATPSPTISPTPSPTPIWEPAAITELQCSRPKIFPQCYSLENNRMLLVYTDFGYDDWDTEADPDLSISRTYLEIIDLQKDSVLHSVEWKGNLSLLEQRFSDGTIVLRDNESEQYVVFDSQLKLLDPLEVSQPDVYFSHDKSKYYYVEGVSLYSFDLDTVEST